MSIIYTILSLTILDDLPPIPHTIEANMVEYFIPGEDVMTILTICLLGIINVITSLGLFVFFVFHDIK